MEVSTNLNNSPKGYLVYAMDMYDYGATYKHSHHDRYEDALNEVKRIIATSINKSGEDGVDEWWTFGETAYIVSVGDVDPPKPFDDEQFVRELCGVG